LSNCVTPLMSPSAKHRLAHRGNVNER
jgi:hypothetical protein